MHINGRLKNGGEIWSWSSGEDGYKTQKIREGEAMEQDIKRLAFNMEKREIKVRQSLMARLHLIYNAIC
jgi:hypothetical protein